MARPKIASDELLSALSMSITRQSLKYLLNRANQLSTKTFVDYIKQILKLTLLLLTKRYCGMEESIPSKRLLIMTP